MTHSEKWEKRNWFLFLIGYFAAGYLACNWFNAQRGFYYDVSFHFENAIPFIPAFILGYLCVYGALAFAYVIIDEIALWRRAAVSIFFMTTVAYIFFLMFPVKMALRPEIVAIGGNGFLDWLTRFYFVIDKPYNAFPSLHVAYPTVATLLVWRHKPVGRWVLLAMALITAVSVILVKQHYISDVIAGCLMAVVCYSVVCAAEPWWRALFKTQKS